MTARHASVVATLQEDRCGSGSLEFAATVAIALATASIVAHGAANLISEQIGVVVNLLASVS